MSGGRTLGVRQHATLMLALAYHPGDVSVARLRYGTRTVRRNDAGTGVVESLLRLGLLGHVCPDMLHPLGPDCRVKITDGGRQATTSAPRKRTV